MDSNKNRGRGYGLGYVPHISTNSWPILLPPGTNMVIIYRNSSLSFYLGSRQQREQLSAICLAPQTGATVNSSEYTDN